MNPTLERATNDLWQHTTADRQSWLLGSHQLPRGRAAYVRVHPLRGGDDRQIERRGARSTHPNKGGASWELSRRTYPKPHRRLHRNCAALHAPDRFVVVRTSAYKTAKVDAIDAVPYRSTAGEFRLVGREPAGVSGSHRRCSEEVAERRGRREGDRNVDLVAPSAGCRVPRGCWRIFLPGEEGGPLHSFFTAARMRQPGPVLISKPPLSPPPFWPGTAE